MGYPDYQVPIVFVLQEGELWPISEWVARQGKHKLWDVSYTILADNSYNFTIYTVPEDKRLFVSDINVATMFKEWGSVLNASTGKDIMSHALLGYSTIVNHCSPPFVLDENQRLDVFGWNSDIISGEIWFNIRAFELDA